MRSPPAKGGPPRRCDRRCSRRRARGIRRARRAFARRRRPREQARAGRLHRAGGRGVSHGESRASERETRLEAYKVDALAAQRGMATKGRESSKLASSIRSNYPAHACASSAAARRSTPSTTRPSRARSRRFARRCSSKLRYSVAKEPAHARDHDWLIAVSLAARDHVIDRWSETTRRTYRDGRKRVYYFSLEFLIGRMLLRRALEPGPRRDRARSARRARRRLRAHPPRSSPIRRSATAASGALQRASWRAWPRWRFPRTATASATTTASSARSCATAGSRRCRRSGWPTAIPGSSSGRRSRAPSASAARVVRGATGAARWKPAETVDAVAFDTPIAGWRGRHVNTLRLWSARATDPLSLVDFNRGDHVGALADRVRLEAISRVLYPSDETAAGQDLRLRQEFFFASASLQDLVAPSSRAAIPARVAARPRRDPAQRHASRDRRAGAHAPAGRRARRGVGHGVEHRDARLQLHQSHAAARGAGDVAGAAARGAPAAAHADHRAHQRAAPRRPARIGSRATAGSCRRCRCSTRRGGRRVRMGHLAFLGAHRVNGVSALHTELMRETVFRDLHAVHPEKIVNKTNGISFRRWLFEANPPAPCAARRRRRAAGAGRSRRAACACAARRRRRRFASAFARQRRTAKDALAALVAERTGVDIDPAALFDVHVKRIHEYKRQLLNVLQTVAAYLAMRDAPEADVVPRVKIFSGKAAAGLPPGEAHHQADPRRRARRSTPIPRCAAVSPSCSCPTTT